MKITHENLDSLNISQLNLSNQEIEIEGAINVHSMPISDYKVRLSYGDLKLIVAMMRDYVRTLDNLKEEGNLPLNEIEYDAYYRPKFMSIADGISKQIDYDYDKQMENCIKKLNKVDNSDVGEEALALAMKR